MLNCGRINYIKTNTEPITKKPTRFVFVRHLQSCNVETYGQINGGVFKSIKCCH